MNPPATAVATSENRTRTASERPSVTTGISPPRAPLAFRVGIVGHRPNRLQHADIDRLSSVLNTILSLVKAEVGAIQRDESWLFGGADATVRAVSPLAEGTDRIFAEQALANGFELCCVMPFHQAEFERDFSPEPALEAGSLERFRHLVGQATARFELDGCRANPEEAYAACGRTVETQSDLLLIVWDGERQDFRGGTEESIERARRLGVPVVWIDAHSPHPWQVLDATATVSHAAAGGRRLPAGEQGVEPLRELVRTALRLPQPDANRHSGPRELGLAASEDPAQGLKMFYGERQPRWTMAVVWNAFRDMVGDGKWPRLEFRVPPFEQAASAKEPTSHDSAVSAIVDRVRSYDIWPGNLAVIYSNKYRSSFVLAFLLAAVAVGMSLLPVGLRISPHHWIGTISVLFELVAILVILGLVFGGRRARWHDRRINYRLTAELVRHLRLVAPLGGGRPFPRIPAHWSIYGQPSSTWMAWYVRAIERDVGLPTAVVNKEHLSATLAHLSQLIGSQIEFHEVAAVRCRRIEKRLHRIEITLLVFTLAACVCHLLPVVSDRVHLPEWLDPLLTFLGGFFPALGAAMAGILNQGEFRRVEMRSESMTDQLLVVRREADDLRARFEATTEPPREQFIVPVAALASNSARLLLNEVLDWRVVFLDRPFEQPPG